MLSSSELRLELLGPVRLGNSAGEDLTPRARKTRALLAVLALAKGPVTRSRITDLLWGDRGEEQAKASLRQALYELRALASGGYVAADRDSVSLGPKKLSTDLVLLQRAIAGGQPEQVADFLQCIDSPLLATLDDIAPELDDWLRDERRRLARAIVEGSSAVAEAAVAKGAAAPARRIADELERLDPLDERVAQLGMRADLASGDRTAASRRYARFASSLRDELGVEPAPETARLLRGPSPTAAALEAPTSSLRPTAAPRSTRVIAIGAAVAVLLSVAAAWFLFPRSGSAAAPTVAVLPFDDFGQKNDDYFAAGVSDEILNLLAHQDRIKVLGRLSADQLARPEESLDSARRLGIAYLLDGSVRTDGERALVIARLTRVSDGSQVWSERYERRAGDIFAVQEEIAGAVATRLAQSFARVKPRETSPEVYDRYLAARQLARQRRDATLQEAEQLLKEAIAKDSNYAPALAQLAQVMMLRTNHPTSYGPLPLRQARSEAAQYARRAIGLDPNLGEAYAALGFLSLSDEKSAPFYRKAVALDPQRPEFHRWLASSLLEMKRFDDAVAEFKRAVAIDPLWGLNYEHLCGTLHRIGRDAEAEKYEQQYLRLSSDEGAKLQFRAFIANSRYQPAEELRYERKILGLYPQERQSHLKLASTMALLGERRQAAKLMAGDRLSSAVLNGDWKALGAVAERMGTDYWDYGPGYWNMDSLLVATGQSRVIVHLYDQAQPRVARGLMNPDRLVSRTTALALSQNGRPAEAQKLWDRQRQLDARLPTMGRLKDEREYGAAVDAAFRGDTGRLIAALDRRSRTRPYDIVMLPAMSLRYHPLFRPVVDDPRFGVIDERIRTWINSQRANAGMPPISKQAWISDPKTILTKN